MDKKNNPSNSKKRIIKDYETLPEDILVRIKMQYPRGFAQNLVSYINKDGKKVSALPFETEDIYYLVRMTVQEAKQIIEDDEDYDDDGVLRDDFAMDVSSPEESSFGDDDEAYFRNEASTIEYADPDYQDNLKDNVFQDSEFADSDLSELDLDDDDDDDDEEGDDADNDDDDDDDFDADIDFSIDEDDDKPAKKGSSKPKGKK